MNDNIYLFFEKIIVGVLKNIYDKKLIFEDLSCVKVVIEPITENDFGDFSSNVAMMYAKKVKMSPQIFGKLIMDELSSFDFITNINIAGPGFINWTVDREFLKTFFKKAIKGDYGYTNIGCGKKVNVEYVSANPTGPLHCGHVRGAVLGDVLAALLKKVGYDVTKEYYINDYGNQVRILIKSLYERYLEALGTKTFEPKDGMYPGEYLKDIAQGVVKEHGDTLTHCNEEDRYNILKKIAISSLMDDIKSDLVSLGIKHDVFTSETMLVEQNKVNETIEYLKQKGCIYKGILDMPKGKVVDDWEPKEQTLFKTKAFGDDTDRPLIKSDGSWTYFASDIAYHLYKIERGYETIIDFFGADHGGYVKRMQAAVSALSDKVELKILLCQLVKFSDNGKEVRMSKRAGNFITLRDIIDAVGKDVIRFIMLTRKSESPLDFDFKDVVEQSKTNPVFYVQYAYARTCSVFRQLKKSFPEFNFDDVNDDQINLDSIKLPEEINIIKFLLDWPRQIIIAATNYEPHKIAFYLYELASLFHNLWNNGKNNEKLRFIIENDIETTKAKIWLVNAVQKVLKSGFGIIGISPLEEL